MECFEKGFKNPDRRYAMFPIIHESVAALGDAAGEELAQRLNALGLANSVGGGQVEKMEALGFAGIVGNIHYGSGYPNETADWKQMEKGFRNIIGRGMTTWIYDEKGYPSGTAGGAVIDENADFIAEGLYCYEYWRTLSGPISYRADVPGDRLYRAMLLPLDGGESLDVTHFQDEKGVLRLDVPAGEFHLFMMSARRLFDGTHAAESFSEPRNYISLNDKKAVEAFIRVTHEKYAECLSDEFGKGVMAFFTDEPSLISWNIRKGVYPIVPWHRNFPEEFQAIYGYPIEKAVVAVVTRRGPEYIKRRCDFWEFVGDSVAENFFGTIQIWCHKHNLKSSGHMLWEESLQSHVYCYGSLYKCGKRMDWPGIDQLASEPQQLMNRSEIPIARLLASFADISGENESFTEFSDHSSRMQNKQIGKEWIRASINWHYAMGINNLTSYYKFDNFRDEDIAGLNLYAARLGYLIRQGRRDCKVAVLYPEASMWALYNPSTEARAIDDSEDTRLLDCTFIKTSWELLHRQIDFDYVDERLILDGKIKDRKLVYHHNVYECFVFPAVHVLSCDTAEKIAEMAKAGIGIVLIGDYPKISRDTGAAAGFSKKLSRFADCKNFAIVPTTTGWSLPGAPNIPAIPRPVTVTPHSIECVLTGASGTGGYVDGEIISRDMLSHTRVLDNGDRLVFLCNMGGKTYEGALHVEGGVSVRLADPYTGDIEDVAASLENGAVKCDIRLRPYEGFCYLVASKT